jgi:cell division protein ZapA
MEPVQVQIYGQVYNLKAAGEPAHLREVASYVDAKMKEIEKGTGTVDPNRVAILTLLTIADELHRMRQRCSALEGETESAVTRLIELTDKARKQE